MPGWSSRWLAGVAAAAPCCSSSNPRASVARTIQKSPSLALTGTSIFPPPSCILSPCTGDFIACFSLPHHLTHYTTTYVHCVHFADPTEVSGLPLDWTSTAVGTRPARGLSLISDLVFLHLFQLLPPRVATWVKGTQTHATSRPSLRSRHSFPLALLHCCLLVCLLLPLVPLRSRRQVRTRGLTKVLATLPLACCCMFGWHLEPRLA